MNQQTDKSKLRSQSELVAAAFQSFSKELEKQFHPDAHLCLSKFALFVYEAAYYFYLARRKVQRMVNQQGNELQNSIRERENELIKQRTKAERAKVDLEETICVINIQKNNLSGEYKNVALPTAAVTVGGTTGSIGAGLLILGVVAPVIAAPIIVGGGILGISTGIVALKNLWTNSGIKSSIADLDRQITTITNTKYKLGVYIQQFKNVFTVLQEARNGVDQDLADFIIANLKDLVGTLRNVLATLLDKKHIDFECAATLQLMARD